MGRLNITNSKTDAKQNVDTAIANAQAMQSQDYNELVALAENYYDVDQHKKEITARHTSIKERIQVLMRNLKMDVIQTNGLKVTLSKRENKSVNEAELLEYCKTLNHPGLVKTIEVVDLDVLEDLTYKRIITPEEIGQFTSVSISESVRISGKPKVRG